ncbi:uncharacterized protein LOC6568706 [Drosophila grimshawi]|uniref:GH23106 n=1 Tax=Drosophila grimshawi TaxID=7222 RepID=B4JVE2_DROGR|nr:uncharacterized protein LOC6568706 [Drosophila grimshawi]EDV98410.1 GH23106 [Drosophila grimshawi]
MPDLENIDAMPVNTPPAAPPAEVEDTEQAQPVRELTQTDHLNKRLLKSLLDSMKMTTETPQNGAIESDSSDFED